MHASRYYIAPAIFTLLVHSFAYPHNEAANACPATKTVIVTVTDNPADVIYLPVTSESVIRASSAPTPSDATNSVLSKTRKCKSRTRTSTPGADTSLVTTLPIMMVWNNTTNSTSRSVTVSPSSKSHRGCKPKSGKTSTHMSDTSTASPSSDTAVSFTILPPDTPTSNTELPSIGVPKGTTPALSTPNIPLLSEAPPISSPPLLTSPSTNTPTSSLTHLRCKAKRDLQNLATTINTHPSSSSSSSSSTTSCITFTLSPDPLPIHPIPLTNISSRHQSLIYRLLTLAARIQTYQRQSPPQIVRDEDEDEQPSMLEGDKKCYICAPGRDIVCINATHFGYCDEGCMEARRVVKGGKCIDGRIWGARRDRGG